MVSHVSDGTGSFPAHADVETLWWCTLLSKRVMLFIFPEILQKGQVGKKERGSYEETSFTIFAIISHFLKNF